MKIVLATSQHLDAIVEINKIIDYGNPKSFMEESIELGRIFVALEDGEVAGYLLYQLIWGNTPFVSLLKIHPTFQRQGYGNQLVTSFEESMREFGYKSYVSSTGDDNPGSQTFHSKMRLSHIGTLQMSFGDETFYRKDL